MYPIWKHHKEYGARLIPNEEHLNALGEGWSDDSSVWRPHLLKEELPQESEAEAPKQKGKKNASKKVSE